MDKSEQKIVQRLASFESEMAVSQISRLSPPWSPYYETFLYKERFIDFFKRSLVFSDGCSYGIGAYRTTVEFGDYRSENLVVHGIESSLVDIEGVEGIFGYFQVNAAVSDNLCEVPYPPEQRIGYPRRATAPESDFVCRIFLYSYIKNGSASPDYPHKIGGIVIFEGELDSETSPQWRCQESAPCSSSDKGERIE